MSADGTGISTEGWEHMKSRIRDIELWSCCGGRAITVDINADELSGEAWRLARCLVTTDTRRRDNGVRVQSLRPNLELARAQGWPETRVASTMATYPDWAETLPIIDWRFRSLHIWPDHHGPHPDPDPERLRLLALSYLQDESRRIADAGGTVISSGDWSVRLAPNGWGEDIVCLPDEQAEARVEKITRALFGGR